MKGNSTTTKQKVIVLGTVFLVVVSLAVWFTPFFLMNHIYDGAKKTFEADSGQPFLVKPIDEGTQELIGVIESSWTCTSEEVDGVYSEALRLAGFDPNVEGVIRLLTFRLPDFSWLDMSQNKDSLEVAVVYATVAPISIDNTIHVSSDRRIVLIRVGERTAMVFRETPDGMHESLWADRKGLLEDG